MAELIQILAGGLTGAFLNQMWTEVRARLSEGKDGRVSALFLAAELDGYATACAHRRQDITNAETSDGHSGHMWRTVPDLPAYSDKTNWRAIGLTLTQRVLAFRAVPVNFNGELEALWEFVDAEDVVGFASDYCVEAGYQAHNLSSALYAKYKIKRLENDGEWDVRGFLRSEWVAIEKKRTVKVAREAARTAERAAKGKIDLP